jgi:nitrogen fixation/metabolism regulation signal transduction histidine kinase
MIPPLPRRRRRTSHQTAVLRLAVLTGLPGALLGLGLLWTGDFEPRTQWTFTLLLGVWWAAFAFTLRERVVRPLQTLSNVLAALREGDFSMRVRGADAGDALGLALLEANALADTLREQRLASHEATALLRRVMQEIDVAVFAFDAEERLRLANRAGARLLARPEGELLGRTAAELGVDFCLRGETPRTVEHAFPGGGGRWEVRRGPFRQGGLPHQLLVLSDVSRALREEERQAWQRLVRVLGHEINNSLAPIQSIAGTLQALLRQQPRPADLDEDLGSGLEVIAGRSRALARFMGSYARLARLPPPAPAPLEVGEWVRRTAGLETRLRVEVVPGPPRVIEADGDQLDQLLINLVRNAADAALETGGGVRAGWDAAPGGGLEVWVEDDGPGLSGTANLFVPFFTTKPHGTGIGLALSRQIAEAHGGTLALENRDGGERGCVARLVLPG